MIRRSAWHNSYVDVDASGEVKLVFILDALHEEDPCNFGVILERNQIAEMRDMILIGVDG
jgi:hypothetical protein